MENKVNGIINPPRTVPPTPVVPAPVPDPTTSPFVNKVQPPDKNAVQSNNDDQQQWNQDIGTEKKIAPPPFQAPEKKPEETAKIEFTEPKKNIYDLPPIGGYKSDKIPSEITIEEQVPEKSPKKFPSYIHFDSRFRRPLIWAGFIVLGLSVLAGGVWGYEFYSVLIRKVALEKILPPDPNLVINVNIDPDSNQFKMLESNMEKFPGYSVLKKNLDKAGEGKTVSQAFQDKLQEMGVDFSSDIKPVLGEEAIFIVQDLKPLGETIQDSVLTQTERIRRITGDSVIAQKTVPKIDTGSGSGPRVLGEFRSTQWGIPNEYYYVNDSKRPKKPVDFVMSAEIKDLKKAKEVLEKIKKDTEKYEMEERKFDRFTYVRLKAKKAEGDINYYINVKETYHALIGGNWVATSDENSLKEMFKRKLAYHSLFKLTQKERPRSLAINETYQKVIRNLNAADGPNLINFYYNLNFEDIFKKQDCPENECFDITDYIKYPNTIINGMLLRSTENGFEFKFLNNQLAVDDIKNRPISASLASKVPEKTNERWTDVFLEYANPKGFYYNFKKNNLTQKGIDSFNKNLNEIKQMTQLDLEKDFIDPINGGAAIAIFCSNSLEPQGSFIVEIKDREKTLDTMKKLVEAIKNLTASMFQSQSRITESMYDQELTPQQMKVRDQYEKEAKAAYDAIMASSLTETSTPSGIIYSYKLPLPEEAMPTTLSFDFSLENNTLVLATNYAVVESLTKDMKDGSSAKLASSANFKKATGSGPAENYSSFFVNTQGLWNSFVYYINKLEPMSEEDQDEVFAIGTLVKTLRLIGTASWVSEGLANSSIYLHIEEPKKEDKERAEKILDRM